MPTDAPADVRRYIEQLYSRDPITRAYGAVRLGRMGDRAEPAVPFLVAMLADDVKLEWEDPKADPADPIGEQKKRLLGFGEERKTSPGREAARAIGKLCAAVPPGLIEALKDPSPHARKNAAEALGGIRDKKATAPLTLALRDEDRDVRAQAAWALGRLRDPAATEALIAATKDPERAVRREVVAALGEIKDPRGLQPLLDALQDAPEVRSAAEAALMETRDLRAVEPLIVTLRHRKEEVRRVSAKLLGLIGDRRAVRPLILSLKDAASDVRFEAATALKKISGEDLGAAPEKWLRWHELQQAAKEIEEKLAGDPVPGYIAALQNPNWGARAYAARTLGDLADPRAIAPLRGALWDKDPTVRSSAATALGKLADPQAVEALIAAISDPDPEVQEAAEGALRAITGANFARDTRKWQEWWDEHKDEVVARHRAKLGEAEPEEAARGIEEDAPPRPGIETGSLVLMIVLGLAAVLPLVVLVLVRALRPR